MKNITLEISTINFDVIHLYIKDCTDLIDYRVCCFVNDSMM